MKKYILGVDSGGTAFKLRAMSLEGQVLAASPAGIISWARRRPSAGST